MIQNKLINILKQIIINIINKLDIIISFKNMSMNSVLIEKIKQGVEHLAMFIKDIRRKIKVLSLQLKKLILINAIISFKRKLLFYKKLTLPI